MKHFKVISICLVTLFLSIAITSYSSTSVSSNNQAFATLANNNIDETIKKSCPTYQGNNPNNIQGLVTDILKACLHQGNVPQPPTDPDPNQGTFNSNIMDFESFSQGQRGEEATVKVEITDTTNGLSKSYEFEIASGTPVTDLFVIPVGANYQASVSLSPIEAEGEFDVSFAGSDCQQNNNVCTGQMGTTEQSIELSILPSGDE